MKLKNLKIFKTFKSFWIRKTQQRQQILLRNLKKSFFQRKINKSSSSDKISYNIIKKYFSELNDYLREKIKRKLRKISTTQQKKTFFKSEIKEVRKILYDSKINGNKKIEEIKNILYDPKNNLFKPEEDHYKPIRIGNAFSSIILNIKVMEIKISHYKLKNILIWSDHV